MGIQIPDFDLDPPEDEEDFAEIEPDFEDIQDQLNPLIMDKDCDYWERIA